MAESGDFGQALPDEDLVKEARLGHLDAYNELVLRHRALAYDVAYRLLGDADDAADATQDGFLKAYQRLHQFRGDGASFRSWLLRIVINSCRDTLRRHRRQKPQPLGFETESPWYEWKRVLMDPREGPEDYVLRRELGERLEAAIKGLPIHQRTVLVLCDIHGFSYREVTEMIRAPIGTVRSRLARARARVRDVILAQCMAPPARAGRQSRAPQATYWLLLDSYPSAGARLTRATAATGLVLGCKKASSRLSAATDSSPRGGQP